MPSQHTSVPTTTLRPSFVPCTGSRAARHNHSATNCPLHDHCTLLHSSSYNGRSLRQHARRANANSNKARRIPRMRMGVPLQERVLRLERALAAAVSQERYSDAASLRDALAALRHADPLLSRRDMLAAAVAREDFAAAAALRDDLALLTERLARNARDAARRVDRILVLRGRADPKTALRVATVSRMGGVELGLIPDPDNAQSTRSGMNAPRIFLQPTWSPSGDYIAMTEVAFHVENVQGMRAIAISDSTSRVVVMNAFDGSIVKSAPLVKPPFFYSWSPCGRTLTMLSNDPTTDAAKVAMSSMQVVAPPGGAGPDLDVVHGPLASGHPLLYDFCPRDSTKVIAHMGNISTVAVVPVKPFAPAKPVLTDDAGSFGTPQWHPLQGKNGREVVLFVERDIPELDEEKVQALGKVQEKALVETLRNLAKTQQRSPSGIEKMKSIFSFDDKKNELPPTPKNVQEKEQSSNNSNSKSKNNSKSTGNINPFEALIGTGTGLLENILRKGAQTFGLNALDKKGTVEEESGNDIDGDEGQAEPSLVYSDEDTEIYVSFSEQGEQDGDEDGPRNGTEDGAGDDGEQSVELRGIPSEFGQRIAGGLRRLLPERNQGTRTQDRWNEVKSGATTAVMNRLVMCDADHPEIRRTICVFSGVMAFKLSPDGSKLATMITDPNTGQDELTLCMGDFSPDSVLREKDTNSLFKNSFRPRSTDADIILSTPYTRVLAFFWSPDSKRLLFLSSIRGSRVGAAQWATFDTETNRVVRYEKFVLSGIYIHCLTFFDQFAASMTPWSPDSDAFCYPGRQLTEAEKERDESAPAAPPSSPLLASLLMQRDAQPDAKAFSAWIQDVPDTSAGKKIPPRPRAIVENVEYASWSPC